MSASGCRRCCPGGAKGSPPRRTLHAMERLSIGSCIGSCARFLDTPTRFLDQRSTSLALRLAASFCRFRGERAGQPWPRTAGTLVSSSASNISASNSEYPHTPLPPTSSAPPPRCLSASLRDGVTASVERGRSPDAAQACWRRRQRRQLSMGMASRVPGRASPRTDDSRQPPAQRP